MRVCVFDLCVYIYCISLYMHFVLCVGGWADVGREISTLRDFHRVLPCYRSDELCVWGGAQARRETNNDSHKECYSLPELL